jgi:hypothetical protein
MSSSCSSQALCCRALPVMDEDGEVSGEKWAARVESLQEGGLKENEVPRGSWRWHSWEWARRGRRRGRRHRQRVFRSGPRWWEAWCRHVEVGAEAPVVFLGDAYANTLRLQYTNQELTLDESRKVILAPADHMYSTSAPPHRPTPQKLCKWSVEGGGVREGRPGMGECRGGGSTRSEGGIVHTWKY